MSDDSGGASVARWLLVLVGAVIAAALMMQALGTASFKAAGPIGSIQAVTLVNGQTYFGTLESQNAAGIVLSDVFDISANVSPDNANERTTKLIRRKTASIYEPNDLAIPADKILSTETVGKDSTVGKGMTNMKTEQEKKAP